MRRITIPLAAGVFLAGLVLLSPSTAAAQGKKPDTETVRFETVDSVDLKGTYWPSSKGKKAPVAILLHKIGGKSKDAGWSELAEELQKANFAVLAFDFRGHGESTGVGAAFWTHPMNQFLRKPPAAQQGNVDMKTFQPSYYPNLINDISAAKRFLERRYNDPGECNCSNIVLIGAEDGATLGALWLASETKRYRIIPVGLMGQKNERPESKDVIACVWLSMSESLGSGTTKLPVAANLKRWLKDAGNTPESKVNMTAESKIPMAFLYGKKEANPNTYVSLVKWIRPKYVPGKMAPDTDELKGTLEFGVNTNLVGHKLLVGELDTRERIVDKYLTKFILDEKKGLNEWEKRESNENTYRWYFPSMRPIQAAMKGEKYLGPVPMQPLGLR